MLISTGVRAPQACGVHEIAPLEDSRWSTFLDGHDSASVFHSREWLDALRRTYGYRVSALTTSGPGEKLTNALVFCPVRSWLTGNRAVSVPFSDHCSPLVRNPQEIAILLSHMKNEYDGRRGRYFEIRPVSLDASMRAGFEESVRFWWHNLDLRPSLDEIFQNFHRHSVRSKIARALRENFVYEEGKSEILLRKFYGLAVLTRRRHNLPPQPLSWFRNLIACMGDRLTIRLASKDGQPAAGILTLRYKKSMTYKYSCSDPHFHRYGSVHLLLWKAIQEAKAAGVSDFDLGRSDVSNEGLIAFKDRWGATRVPLRYFRFPASAPKRQSMAARAGLLRRVVALAPECLLVRAGAVLYRHWA